MACIPKDFVNEELRKEIFFNLADLVYETKVRADCIRCWHEKMTQELQDYVYSLPHAERERQVEQLLEASTVAATLADASADATTLIEMVTILNTATDTGACRSTFVSAYYQFFIQTATYGRRYFQRAGYDADSFVPSHYIFLVMSFDSGLRQELEQALHEQCIQ